MNLVCTSEIIALEISSYMVTFPLGTTPFGSAYYPGICLLSRDPSLVTNSINICTLALGVGGGGQCTLWPNGPPTVGWMFEGEGGGERERGRLIHIE